MWKIQRIYNIIAVSEPHSSILGLMIQSREPGPITITGHLGKEQMMNVTLTLSNLLAMRAPFLNTIAVCLHKTKVLEQLYLLFLFSSLGPFLL